MSANRPIAPAQVDALVHFYPVLQTLDPTHRTRLLENLVPLAAAAGTVLFDEGDPCTHHPFLIEGAIRVVKCSNSSGGDEILLYRLLPGESCVVTAVTLLGGAPYSARGVTETAVSALALPRALFVELAIQSEPFRTFVFSSLSNRMSQLMTLVDSLAFRGVGQRLAARLLEQDEITIHTTHQTLANELGTRREVVSRILETLQDSHILQLSRGRVEVLDRDALQAFAQSAS